MKLSLNFRIVLLATILFCPQPACGDQSAVFEPGHKLAEENSRSPSKPSASLPSAEDYVSPGAAEIAELAGLSSVYQKLMKEQKAVSERQGPAAPLEEMKSRQRIAYLHDKLNQRFQTLFCEIEMFKGKLDYESSQQNDLKALIADQRMRLQHRTSFVNLVSGGLTKLGAYSSALAGAGELPVDILEIFDGGVQTGLSATLIRKEHNEELLNAVTPESLITFMSNGAKAPSGFPPLIWAYLNSPSPMRKDGKSRRQVLIDSWIGEGRVIRNSGTMQNRTPKSDLRLSPDAKHDLDITMAMLADIKSMLFGFEKSLFDLSTTLDNSYEKDPEF